MTRRAKTSFGSARNCSAAPAMMLSLLAPLGPTTRISVPRPVMPASPAGQSLRSGACRKSNRSSPGQAGQVPQQVGDVHLAIPAGEADQDGHPRERQQVLLTGASDRPPVL